MLEIENIIGIAAFLLFLVVPILKWLFTQITRSDPARPAGGRPAGGLGDHDEDDEEVVLNEEIERFLREASGQRNPRPSTQRAPEPVVAEVVRPQRLSDSGSRHLETSVRANEQRFGQRTSHLGEEVGLADKQMESRIYAAFDHQLGGLTNTSVGADVPDADMHDETPGASKPSSPAAELAATFREPQSIRQAIILSEILSRPEHRWSRVR